MRGLLRTLAIAAAGSAAHAATPIYLSPDVPTDPAPAFPTVFPWTISRYTAVPPSYGELVTIPGSAALDGIHKLDRPGARGRS